MLFSGHIDGIGPLEITRLDLGSLTVPPNTPMGGQTLPVYAYLVSRPDGLVLFDTGLGSEHQAFDRSLKPLRRSLEDALAGSHVLPADIQYVVNCHLHYDHAGGNTLFTATPIFVQAREYEARSRLDYFIPERFDFPGVDLRIVQGETAILPGIRVVPTPGHTPGHQSLVIEERSGPLILAGQAAYTAAEFNAPERAPARGFKTASNPREFLASIRYLRELKPQRVYFSHDAQPWEPGTIAAS